MGHAARSPVQGGSSFCNEVTRISCPRIMIFLAIKNVAGSLLLNEIYGISKSVEKGQG